MKRVTRILMVAVVMSSVLVGIDKKGSFDLDGKDPEVPVTPN